MQIKKNRNTWYFENKKIQYTLYDRNKLQAVKLCGISDTIKK